MNHRPALIARLAGAALLCASLAQAAPVARRMTATAQLGDVQIRLPVPGGFADPSATPATTRDLVARGLPPGTRLMAMLLAQDFLQGAIPGEPQRLSRYILVTAHPAMEHGITESDFERVKSDIHAQAESVKAAHVASPGVFDEHLDSIAMASVQPLMTTGSNGGRSVDQVMAMGIVLLAGKPIVVSVYSDDLTPGDIDWAEREVREWMQRVQELNADLPANRVNAAD